MTEIAKMEVDFSLFWLLTLHGHLLPRFGGARGTLELAYLPINTTHMYVGLEHLRHHKQQIKNLYTCSEITRCLTLSKDVTSSSPADRGKLFRPTRDSLFQCPTGHYWS
jgi:hypothetical protein